MEKEEVAVKIFLCNIKNISTFATNFERGQGSP